MTPSHDANADGMPVDVLVTAMASRLADLQGARVDPRSPMIVAPTSQLEAGRRALVAGNILACLESRLQHVTDTVADWPTGEENQSVVQVGSGTR